MEGYTEVSPEDIKKGMTVYVWVATGLHHHSMYEPCTVVGLYDRPDDMGFDFKSQDGWNHTAGHYSLLNGEIKVFVKDAQEKEDTTENQHGWSDSHYSFKYCITEQDTENGNIKVDPYFVSKQWKLGQKDDTGTIFHILKTIARFGDKNSKEREIKALYAQVKRLAELEGVNLD